MSLTLNGTTNIVQSNIGSNVAGTGPAFSATAPGTQTVTSNVWTKVTLNEDFDTNNNFASSTFMPTVAGYYNVNAVVAGTAGSMTSGGVSIYKNGTEFSTVTLTNASSTTFYGPLSTLIYMNGTTDYIELYGRLANTAPLTIINLTKFSASLVRAA